MKNGLVCVCLVIGLGFAPFAAAQGFPQWPGYSTDAVYFAVPEMGAIFAFDAIDPGLEPFPVFFASFPQGPSSVPNDQIEWNSVFNFVEVEFSDLAIGPDDHVYFVARYEDPAAGPFQGLFRFNPTAPPIEGEFPYTFADVEPIPTPGINAPVGLWFNDKGDLFLTDKVVIEVPTGGDEQVDNILGTAVWVYRDLVPFGVAPPAELAELVTDVEAPFSGQGVTQLAPGHLLFVDQDEQMVYSLAFDSVDGLADDATVFYENPEVGVGLMEISTYIEDPIGIARSANGTVFVASEYEVVRIAGEAGCGTYFFDEQMPRHLEFASEDIFYATTDLSLWKVDFNDLTPCIPEEVFPFDHSLTGIAVARSGRMKQVPDIDEDLTQLFSFYDHAYELSFVPEEACMDYVEGDPVSLMDPVIATETRPACLQYLIENYVVDEFGDLVYGLEGSPMTYAGDGGFAQVYSIDSTDPPCDPDEVTHSVSAYARLAENPRIVRCHFPEGTDPCHPEDCGEGGCHTASCEIIRLESFFPFNGIFPEDARIKGVRSSTIADFSEYFVADIADFGDYYGDDVESGCFCGFRNPLPDIQYLDPDDPFAGLPRYKAGRTVPIKFRVAALGEGESCAVDVPCNSCPHGWVRDAEVLLSVAKVFNERGEEDFVPIEPTPRGNPRSGNIFRPGTQYHYNLNTSGYEPGVYQVVAIALTGNFALEWTYFAIR